MRGFPILLPALLISACTAPQPPKPAAGASRIPVQKRATQPAQAPSWQAVPAKADGAAVPGGRRHIVKKGETGLSIARAYGVPWSRITAANGLNHDSMLLAGQPLFIPKAQQQAGRQAPRPGKPGRNGFALDIDEAMTGSTPAGDALPAARAPVPPTQAAATVPQLAWPVDGRVILSHYGPKAGGRYNDGLNIKTTRGAPVRAAAEGEVLYVGDAIAGFGLMILIRHPGGTVTAYGHLEDALVDRGQKVQRGQPIARAGSSGAATEPQLHFQIRQGRRTLDPALHLPR